MWFHTKKIRRQVCLEPDLYVATRCHAFRSSCDVALASPMATSGNKSFESTKIDSRRTPSTTVDGCLAGRWPLCGRQKKTCHRLARQNGEAAKTSRIDSLRFLVYTRWSLQHSNQSTMCKLQGHVGTAIQALGFGLDRAASSLHPRAGLLIYQRTSTQTN